MHALLTSLGTDGDVFPYIGLGQRLRQRGHRVTLLSGERYQALAARSGFEFAPLTSEVETQAMLADPDLWHPWKCARVVARWGASKIPSQYEAITAHLDGHDTVLVANPGVLAARMIHELLGIPLVSVILQPWVIPSSTAPPVVPVTLPRGLPRLLGNAYWSVFHWGAHQFVGRDVNQARAGLGLPPVPRVFRWWLAPERVLGLFPAWYGPPQADWPTQIRVTGFPLFDGRLADGMPEEIRQFLAAGEPPVAITFGTGMQHAAWLFDAAVKACAATSRRAILLTKHFEQLPSALPATMRAFAFAPFRELFPKCAAVIHHGGIGTTSQALAAGAPQLILPFAFDQPDNGVRIERLGVGTWFHPRRGCGPRIAEALNRIITPTVQSRCREVAARFVGEDGLTNAATEIESLATIRAGANCETASVDR